MRKPILSIALIAITFLTSMASSAQVSTNSGSGLNASYPDLATAITALNAATITSPVSMTLVGNETAPVGGYTITAQGTAVNTILISGTSSVITASSALVAGTLNDAIFKLVGADYVTIQRFTMMENPANTITAAATNNMTEWGVALLYASTTNGAQNNTIQINTIDLDRTYQNTFGIYSNSTHGVATPTTSATATTSTGGNHGLKLYANSITDVNIGILVVGPTAAADQNDGLDIGGFGNGNTITNYGTTGTFSGFANVSGSVFGILVRNTKNFNVSYNSVTSSNGGVTAGALRGIYVPAFSNAPIGTIVNAITNNVVSVRSAAAGSTIVGIHNDATTTNITTTLNINDNDFNTCGHTVAGTAVVTFVQNAATAGTLNINNNKFTNLTVNTTNTVYLINNNCSTNSFTVNNNSVVGTFSKTGVGGILYGYYDFGSPTGGTATISNNNFSNMSVTGATTFYGIRQYTATAQIENITNNVVTGITGGTAAMFGISHGYGAAGSIVNGNNVNSITSTSAINGINLGDNTGGTVSCFNNTVYGLTSTGAFAVTGISNALSVSSSISKNKIYNLESNNAAGTVNGILVAGGVVNVFNNILGDLRTPSSNLANPLVGINITAGTSVNAYYNTVMLNGASSGALFGSSAVSAATGTNVDLRNNIFVNNSSITGAGLAAAYRRSSATLTSYAAASNNNLFYGSTIFTDGTNTDATLGAYKTRVASRDASAISENPTFTSTVGANGQFLHIDPAVPTLIEGNGTTIATYTDDFDGDVRNVSTPDIGADEFAGTPASTVAINSVAITPLGNQCTAISRNVTANITAGASNITSVNLNYSFNGVAQTPIAMTGGTLTAGSTSTFAATIPVAVPANANVTWNVSAVDPIVSKSTSGTAYQDEPLFGASATANASVNTFCTSGTSVLSAILIRNGIASSIGTDVTLTGAVEELTAFCNRRVSYRVQLVYTAAELAASGLNPGPITSLAFNISTLGDSASNTLFTVKMGTTALTALTDYVSTASFTTVFPSGNYTHAVGSNVINFATPFAWDGTSNVIVELTHNGVDSINNAQTYYTATAGNTVAYGYNGAVVGTLSPKRFNIVFGGNVPSPASAYSWSDGSTVVGTTNNLSVSPTVTTTYTGTLTAAGCTIATNSVVITVNNTAAPTGASPQTFTPTQTLADLVVAGSNIIWYASASDAAAAINPLVTSTLLVDATTYYATQTIAGCSSATSLGVLAQAALSSNQFDLTNFKFYPNPVTNVLNVDYSQKITNVAVYNAIGQQVIVIAPNAASTTINMAHLSQGIYFVKLSTDNATQTIRVVKN
ncbi:MAG: T9SS type A sorting domain-containing protein [Flavobacterium sp.]